MTAFEDHSDIDRVREATDLARLIGEHVALKPKGREYIGICPFHEDHRPSFTVVTHKGNAFYKCFACGASGDCFRFVMDYHKMGFPEALSHLAERAGITLRPQAHRTATGDAPQRGDLQKAVAFAADLFQKKLRDPIAGAAAREIIEKRGISAEMVDRFMIGAAPDGYDFLLRRIEGKPSAIRTALAAGLLKQRQSGDGHYDAFRNRLIFPICDDIGRVIAFGGRTLKSEDEPKYLNSAENPLFRKSRTLYGLHLAKRAIIESGQAIVTEGYTDVIACHQAGIVNVVATLGTALTAEHARVLSRLCDTVVLVFDGDEAGQKAAERGVEVFFSEPVDIRIAVLPDGLDPDDLLRQPNGVERFGSALDQAADALEYKLRCFQAQLDAGVGLSRRQQQLERFLADLADLGFGSLQGVRKRLVITRLADLLHVSIADIERALPRRRPRPAQQAMIPAEHKPESAPSSVLDTAGDISAPSRARRLAEREVLAIVLFEPTSGAEAIDQPDSAPRRITEILAPGDFTDATAGRIAEVIFPHLESGDVFSMQQLLSQLAGEDARAVASELYFEGRRLCGDEGDAAGDALKAALAALKVCIDRDQYQRETAAFGMTGAQADAGPTIDAVAEQIAKRRTQDDLPAAIPHGVRS